MTKITADHLARGAYVYVRLTSCCTITRAAADSTAWPIVPMSSAGATSMSSTTISAARARAWSIDPASNGSCSRSARAESAPCSRSRCRDSPATGGIGTRSWSSVRSSVACWLTRMACTSRHSDTPIRLVTDESEWITVTDPGHPLYGRRYALLSPVRSSSGRGYAHVSDTGDVVLKIPIAATSLQPAPPGRPSSKLSLDAIRDLLRLALRVQSAKPSIPEILDHSGSETPAEPPALSSPPPVRR
jgi:hypothetical protein